MRSQSDFLAGAAAAISVIALWAGLGAPLWVAAISGIVVYTGIRLLMSNRTPQDVSPPPIDPQALVAKMRAAEVKFTDPAIRAKIEALCFEGETLIADLQARPESSPEGLFLVGQYLDQANSGLELFLNRTRGGAEWTTKASGMLSALLDTIKDRFEKLHERVNAQDDAALAGEIKVLTDTLDEVDKVTLNMRTGA